MMACQIYVPTLTILGLCCLLGAAEPDKVSGTCCLEDSTCLSKSVSDGSDAVPPASLLQRVFHREGATLTLEQEPKDRGQCTGTTAQGRCWHLSEMGESCATTCETYGEAFSYVVANTSDPLTPYLVGHVPVVQQEPWATLECYHPSEDRYHLANGNSANHFVGDIGAWSHSECRLACPCVSEKPECRWKQPPACAPEFEWKGKLYSGCPSIDHDKPWCQHHFQHSVDQDKNENSEQAWSNCIYDCGPSEKMYVSADNCEWKAVQGCEREFDYEGSHFTGCTAIDHDTPWCSLSHPYAGDWAHCVYSCQSPNEVAERMMEEVMEDNMLCTWQSNPNCSKPFVYKAVSYNGCTDLDNPTPWCSHDLLHDGSWSLCKRVCTEATVINQASEPMSVTTPVPTVRRRRRSERTTTSEPEPDFTTTPGPEPSTETVTVTVPVYTVKVPVPAPPQPTTTPETEPTTETVTVTVPVYTVKVPVPAPPQPTTTPETEPSTETVTVTVPVYTVKVPVPAPPLPTTTPEPEPSTKTVTVTVPVYTIKVPVPAPAPSTTAEPATVTVTVPVPVPAPKPTTTPEPKTVTVTVPVLSVKVPVPA